MTPTANHQRKLCSQSSHSPELTLVYMKNPKQMPTAFSQCQETSIMWTRTEARRLASALQDRPTSLRPLSQ
eukprot:scaffold669070_cov75-Prasinocladus_malaysianus.AAC.1